MPIARSKVTTQGQISVPVDIRRKLGIVPGSVLEWAEEGGKIAIRRAGKFTFEDIHRKIFGTRTPKRRSVKEMKEGIAEHVRERYART
ncbi:MAG TPA: AbrB/MazE/SpoVT family DNA-binding domain-containing protein [Bryobacteraceae bacterium]|nr:AbrB/MazE/SpoVT family DNA-binding domain-containing protein [Bryobacteraceae bacterium]